MAIWILVHQVTHTWCTRLDHIVQLIGRSDLRSNSLTNIPTQDWEGCHMPGMSGCRWQCICREIFFRISLSGLGVCPFAGLGSQHIWSIIHLFSYPENPNVKYYVKKTVNGKSAGKSVNGTKTTLTVKKGATVKVKVKAYIYDVRSMSSLLQTVNIQVIGMEQLNELKW